MTTLQIHSIHLNCHYNLLIQECNAGNYKSGNSCLMCTANTIKSTSGDTVNCLANPPCNGVGKIPDQNHTKCGGKIFFYS